MSSRDNLNDLQLTGLLGYPVEHSLSPAMHNEAFESLGLNYIYLPFAIKPENIADAVRGIRAFNFKGVNVTIPHKQAVIPYLDQVSEEARLIGAVNAIENQDGKLIGHNTDGRGFIRSLKEEGDFNPQDKQALVVGAGGAARAVVVQLALSGIEKIFISDINLELAEKLVRDLDDKVNQTQLEVIITQEIATIINDLDLVVNATPVGMYPKVDVDSVIAPDLLHNSLVVYDLVYNPEETVLIKAAKEAGAIAISGLGMLLYQGAIAFEIWTREDAPLRVMRNALKNSI